MVRRAASFALAVALATLAGDVAIAQFDVPRRDVSREQARSSPAWVRDAVVYEINPRTFSAQGNFAGITARLDDLRGLGVSVLWLMPIHPIGRERAKGSVGSPYAVRDFYAINPDYGTEDDLRRLVTGAHQRGMKVIIDIVANHTAWDSVMMKTPEFYTRRNGSIVAPAPDWTDVADLDYGNTRLREYMTDMLAYWIREFDLDGFRCDVAFGVPTDFWEHARDRLEKVKADIFLLAESAEPELLVKAFDADYTWPFHNALTEVLQGTLAASAIRDTWERERGRYPKGALRLYFSDNHDERRAIARFGEKGALAASALVFTLDGLPLLYNGQEIGDTTESGAPALFERLPVFWAIGERRPEFPRFYKRMIELRRASPSLRQGTLEWVRNADEDRVVTYLRRTQGEETLVALNLSNRPWVGLVEVGGPQTWVDITPSLGQEDTPSRPPAAIPGLSLDAWGFRMFRRP